MRRGSPRFAAWGLVLLALPAGCSRRALSSDDAGGTGHVGIDGGGVVTDLGAADVPPRDVSIDGIGAGDSGGDGGAIACGAVTCTGTDLCVTSYGCGGPLDCRDLTDAGACPTGTTFNQNCLSVTGRAGCTPDCPPPSHACVPQPATCTHGITCSCLPASVCASGTCQRVQGRAVQCGAS